MGPESVKDDTLFLRARPLAVLAFGPDIATIEYIIIDVYGQPKHPVAPEVGLPRLDAGPTRAYLPPMNPE
jgi:hypothetical protein